MDATTDVTMKRVRPFWASTPGRATLITSSVTEEERASGLVLPVIYEGDDGVKRGIVLDVTETGCLIDTGSVVFYRGDGIRIGDVIVVNLTDIIAYEVDQ